MERTEEQQVLLDTVYAEVQDICDLGDGYDESMVLAEMAICAGEIEVYGSTKAEAKKEAFGKIPRNTSREQMARLRKMWKYVRKQVESLKNIQSHGELSEAAMSAGENYKYHGMRG